MTDTDKLTEILSQWKSGPDNSLDSEGHHDHLKDAHSAILDLFKSLVPDTYAIGRRTDYEIGHDSCVSKLLANIERMRK